MHLSPETQASYAEGTLPTAEARSAHRHLAACAECAVGVADQLAVIHAIAQLPKPEPAGDGWAAISLALGPDWQQPAKLSKPLLPLRRQRWAAAALLTAGLSVALALSIAQPAPADDELDHIWQEHHRFGSINSVSAYHVSQYRALTSTHRLRESDSP